MSALNEHGKEHILEYSQITKEVFIGTNMCCQTRFAKELLDKGIRADFSLEEERLDAPYGVKFFIWLPVKDHTSPTAEQFEFGSASIDHFVSLELPVYVHCKNGHGRAPTMVAAYLMKYQEMTLYEAVAYLKEKRPSIHIEKEQIQGLEEFQKG